MFIYDRKEIENSPNPLEVSPLSFFKYPLISYDRSYYNQGLACDGKYIYMLHGYVNPFTQHILRKMTFQGEIISETLVDGIRGYYTREELFEGHPIYGCPQSMEPEGLAIKDGQILMISTDNWRNYGDIVSYRGKSFAFTGSSRVGSPDTSGDIPYWVYTKRPANKGQWQEGVDYNRGSITRIGKVLVAIKESSGEIGEYPIDANITRLPSPAGVVLPNTSYDISFPFGEVFQICQYGTNSEEMSDVISITENQLRISDNSDNSVDNSERGVISKITQSNDRSLIIRASTNLSQGPGINLFSDLHASPTGGSIRFYTNGSNAVQINSEGSRALRPGSDGIQSLGTASNRWGTIFSETGTINTSDERKKQDITDIDDAIFRAWEKIEYSQYRFKDSVKEKGSDSRWHFGLIAQRVKEAFESEGLDPFSYGILCYDEWDEEPEEVETWEEIRDSSGEVVLEAGSRVVSEFRSEGNQYGIRYEEALALECAYLRYKLNSILHD